MCHVEARSGGLGVPGHCRCDRRASMAAVLHMRRVPDETMTLAARRGHRPPYRLSENGRNPCAYAVARHVSRRQSIFPTSAHPRRELLCRRVGSALDIASLRKYPKHAPRTGFGPRGQIRQPPAKSCFGAAPPRGSPSFRRSPESPLEPHDGMCVCVCVFERSTSMRWVAL